MCPCRLERVSWPLDASVSAMIAYDLIFGAAAFAGLCAGVSDLFSHIEQINSEGSRHDPRSGVFRGFAAHAFMIFAYHISQFDLSAPAVQPPRFQRREDAETRNGIGSIIWTIQ